MKNYIAWLKKSFYLIVFFILIISFFNYKVDSLGLFGNSSYLVKAAKALTNGKIIAGLLNYDERLFQELIIKNLQVKIDVIAIGSSRTMQLRKRFLPCKNIHFFNHSVSGASLEDYIAIIGAYEFIHGYLPKTIILGTDPWIFNKYNNQNRWKSLNKYYNFEIKKFYHIKELKYNINSSKWKQLINWNYTISNMKFLKKLLFNEGKFFYETNTIDIDDSIKEIDGSRHYPYKERYIQEKDVKISAISYSKTPVYSLERFNKLDNKKLFEDFIDYLQGEGVNIVLFLPPYNPITYDILISNQKYKYMMLADKYLNKIANKKKLTLIGSFNPHIFGFTNKDFIDGMHGHEIVIKKIIEKGAFKNICAK